MWNVSHNDQQKTSFPICKKQVSHDAAHMILIFNRNRVELNKFSQVKAYQNFKTDLPRQVFK